MEKPLKILVLHAFIKPDSIGGAEKLILQIRDYYKADLLIGALDKVFLNKNKDEFTKKLWNENFKFEYLHLDSQIPIWKQLKRQIYFLFTQKIKTLVDYDVILFSGNIGFLPRRLRKIIDASKASTKMIMYCNTPPRFITDQFENKLNQIPKVFHPFLKIIKRFLLKQYVLDSGAMDLVIANSCNIKNRLQKFTGIEAKSVIFPSINSGNFKFISQEGYFLSYGRLEEMKRIPLIIDAFEKMPDKKLIIASSGPLKDWLIKELETRNLKNITYEGIVTDQRLNELVGNCRAGIYIPIDEDAGMTQCELMAAGKPVIGVADGGLLETIIDKETGVLLTKDLRVEDLVEAVQQMSPQKALKMKESCIEQSQKFNTQAFFEKMDIDLQKLVENEKI